MAIVVCFVGCIGLTRDTAGWTNIASDLKRWLFTVESAEMTEKFNERAKISLMEVERTRGEKFLLLFLNNNNKMILLLLLNNRSITNSFFFEKYLGSIRFMRLSMPNQCTMFSESSLSTC